MTMTAVVADAAAGLPVDDPVAISAAACLFRGFGDPARLTILRHLAHSEYKVKDLTDRLGLAQSTVSGHLACLRDCGLVESRPEGRASVFRLAHHQAAPEDRLQLQPAGLGLQMQARPQQVALLPLALQDAEAEARQARLPGQSDRADRDRGPDPGE